MGYRLTDSGGRPDAPAERPPGTLSSGRRGLPVGRPPFVGRERELAALEKVFAAMLGGRTGFVGLVGEAGIGKTRLAEEFCARANEFGARVCWGTCHESLVRPPYEPWVEILESLERGSSVELVDELFPTRPLMAPHREGAGARARLELLCRLGEILKDRAGGAPLCLVLEDVQWADSSTLLALRHAVQHLREAPLLLLFTYTPSQTVPDTAGGRLLTDVVADVVRGDLGLVLSLVPLSQPEVALFVELCESGLPGEDGEDLAKEAYRQTEGNPFFLTQFMRMVSLSPAGRSWRDWDLDLGSEEGVRSVILHRLSKLSPPCRRWLEAGCVCGSEFHVAVAAEAAGLLSEGVPVLLSEATGKHIVVQTGEGPERCRFAHRLIKDVLYHNLSAEARARLHAGVAAILERTYADELDRHAAELAHHYRAAVTAGSPDKAVAFSIRAGEVAARRYAWEEACAHWQGALSLLDMLPTDSPHRARPAVSKVFEDLGDAYGHAAQLDRAIDAYENSAAHRPWPASVSLARVTRKQVDHLYARGEQDRALAAVIQAESALAAMPEPHDREWWQEWLDVELARCQLHYCQGEVEAADALHRQVEPVAGQYGTNQQRARCETAALWIDLSRRQWVATADTIAIAERCAASSLALGSPLDIQDAHMLLGTALFFSPEHRASAGEHLRRFLSLARQNHDLILQVDALESLSTWHRLRGEIDEVRRYASEVLLLTADRQIGTYRAEARGDLAWAALREGNVEEARALAVAGLEEFERRFPRRYLEWQVRWPLLALAATDGDLPRAALQARSMLDGSQHRMPEDLEALARRFLDQQSNTRPEACESLDELVGLARENGYL